MIRPATEADIPRLLEMAKSFVELAWARIGVGYDEESCRATLQECMANGLLLIALDGNGMIGAVAHPWHFNRNVMTATEIVWWVENGCKAGRALRNAAEAWAKQMGAETMNMACQAHMRSATFDRLYRMAGYSPSEHIFIKDLR